MRSLVTCTSIAKIISTTWSPVQQDPMLVDFCKQWPQIRVWESLKWNRFGRACDKLNALQLSKLVFRWIIKLLRLFINILKILLQKCAPQRNQFALFPLYRETLFCTFCQFMCEWFACQIKCFVGLHCQKFCTFQKVYIVQFESFVVVQKENNCLKSSIILSCYFYYSFIIIIVSKCYFIIIILTILFWFGAVCQIRFHAKSVFRCCKLKDHSAWNCKS